VAELLVSVMMITYNHAPYIAKGIEGVLQQKTNFPFELVIGEDCSTDGTREIVFEYQKKYPDIIRVITSDKNVGMIKNGSRTQKACRGKYVAICEGDDYWHHPCKLQKQVDYMENHPECGLVHSDYDRYIVRSRKIVRNFNQTMNNKLADNLDICSILRAERYLHITTCTALVRRDILSEISDSDPLLYESGKFLIGDTPRWAEIAWRSKTHYVDESLSTYSVLEESASKSADPIKMLKFGKSNRELFLYLIQKYDLPEAERQYHTEYWCKYALELAFYQNDKDVAMEVRKKKRRWSIKEHLFYYGTMNTMINGSLKVISSIKRKIVSKFRLWNGLIIRG
jgi:glycosyltransferase involved in cell wall biosynthesis